MLLAYYEFTKKQEVLTAVEKAMALTMKNYNKGARNPFFLKNAFGGVTHGLMMTDVCETLYRITGKKANQDYATYLYRAFSTYSINRSFNDVRYSFLTEKDSMFEGHAVHTYEHLRSLINAYYHTGYPELKKAFENAMYKLAPCILPSGAGHGNEWIAKMKADPTFTPTEFCTMLELRNFFGSAIQKTGNIDFADKAEKLTFNGIMGARNTNGTALSYGKNDNCFVLDGHFHDRNEKKKDSRYKYSPTHSDPAVCCVPNYTRNFTYYLDYMWMKTSDGLAATLYGPSVLKTKINGIELQIEQRTNYPFSNKIEFIINYSGDTEFSVYFRKPEWTKTLEIESPNAVITEENGFYKTSKKWQNGDLITLTFHNETQAVPFDEFVYFQRGPLVFAYPIPHSEKTIKEYKKEGFKDYYCLPTNNEYKEISFAQTDTNIDFGFEYVNEELPVYENPWYNANIYLKVNVLNKTKKKQMQLKLVPMGNTILRQVAFKTN